MKHFFAKSCFAVLMTLILSLPSIADDIFIRNRAYKGEVISIGGTVELELKAAAQALRAELEKGESSWILDGEPIETRAIEGKSFVTLDSLGKAGYKIIKNPNLGTIDVHQKSKAVAKSGDRPKGDASDWGAINRGPTVVYFGADW